MSPAGWRVVRARRQAHGVPLCLQRSALRPVACDVQEISVEVVRLLVVMTHARRWTTTASERSRLVVLLVGLTVFLAKLLIANRTYGTQDIYAWIGFARGVNQRGPVGIY